MSYTNQNAPNNTPSSGRVVHSIVVAFVDLEDKIVDTNAWIVRLHSVLSVLFLP